MVNKKRRRIVVLLSVLMIITVLIGTTSITAFADGDDIDYSFYRLSSNAA